MHVVQTAALPPNHGRMRRAISGCTRNSRNDDRNMVPAYSISPGLRFASTAFGQVGGEAGIRGGREGEQPLLGLRRNRQRFDEGRELLPAQALAATERLELVVGV